MIKAMLAAFQQFKGQQNPDFFKKLAAGQDPHLFIVCCSDSRLVVEKFFNLKSGDALISSTPGGMIPVYHVDNTDSLMSFVDLVTTTFVHEPSKKYFIVMGHTECAAIEKIALGENTHWLTHGSVAAQRAQAKKPHTPLIDLQDDIVRENILLQAEHLKTYPGVKACINNNTLDIICMLFDIKHGNILVYNQEQDCFIAYPTPCSQAHTLRRTTCKHPQPAPDSRL